MSKSVEEMKKASKQISWLTAGIGIFFLVILALFIINTRRIEPIVVTMFGGFALLMFLMAFFLPRTAISKLERNEGWSKPGDQMLGANIFLFTHEILLVIFLIYFAVLDLYENSNYRSSEFIFFSTMVGVSSIGFTYFDIRMVRYQNLYVGFTSKAFPDLSEKNIGLPAHLLERHGIPFRSLGTQKAARWTTFNEVHELPNGVFIRIRVPKDIGGATGLFHPETGLKFTVEIGPENEGNRDFIQELKRIMDHLDEE